MTLEQIKNQLSAIEPDESIYSGIGASEIPLLEQLLQDKEAWITSRAVFALSRVSDARAVTLLSKAVTDPRPEVRVSVAACASKLKPEEANGMLLKLLADTDLGVRKFAVKSVSGLHSKAVQDKIRDIQSRDPVPQIRDFADFKLRELAK